MIGWLGSKTKAPTVPLTVVLLLALKYAAQPVPMPLTRLHTYPFAKPWTGMAVAAPPRQ